MYTHRDFGARVQDSPPDLSEVDPGDDRELPRVIGFINQGHPHVGINGPVPPEDQPLAPPPMIAEGNARLGPHVHGARCYVCPWVWVIPSVSLICGIAGLLVGIIGFTKGMAIGFSVGVVVGALVGLLLYFLCKKCKRRNANYHPVE